MASLNAQPIPENIRRKSFGGPLVGMPVVLSFGPHTWTSPDATYYRTGVPFGIRIGAVGWYAETVTATSAVLECSTKNVPQLAGGDFQFLDVNLHTTASGYSIYNDPNATYVIDDGIDSEGKTDDVLGVDPYITDAAYIRIGVTGTFTTVTYLTVYIMGWTTGHPFTIDGNTDLSIL